jgi:hypothetical protein
MRLTSDAHWMLRRVLAIVVAGGLSASAQAPSASWEEYRRDSIKWVRDSTALDSASRTVPTDSLRALYRLLTNTNQPVRVFQAQMCESYRLHRDYGRAAYIAEDRIQAEEWPPSVQAAVRRSLHAWIELTPLTSPFWKVWPDTLPPRILIPTRDDCVPSPAPLPLGRVPREALYRESAFRPLPPNSLAIGSLEWHQTFRGRAEGTVGGSDSLVSAASASLEFRGWDRLVLTISDKKTYYGLEFHWLSDAFLRPGVYPIFNGWGPVGGSSNSVLMNIDSEHPVEGTVTIARADTTEVEGRVDMVMHKNGGISRQWRLPADSIYDVPIQLRFRAKYDKPSRWSWLPVMYPHPWNPEPVPPPDDRILKPLYKDRNVACQRLPIYRRESVIGSMPRTAPVSQATAKVEIILDTLGHPAHIWLLSLSDTSASVREGFSVARQSGLRFMPAQPTGDHRFSNIRCSLTIRRADRN